MTEQHPLADLALTMALADQCEICGERLTIHDMRGDQVVAANIGGSKQAHRYCWEKKEAEEAEEGL